RTSSASASRRSSEEARGVWASRSSSPATGGWARRSLGWARAPFPSGLLRKIAGLPERDPHAIRQPERVARRAVADTDLHETARAREGQRLTGRDLRVMRRERKLAARHAHVLRRARGRADRGDRVS